MVSPSASPFPSLYSSSSSSRLPLQPETEVLAARCSRSFSSGSAPGCLLTGRRRMRTVHIFILYGGQWIKSDSGNEYVGGEMHALSVDRNITYGELVRRLFSLVNVDPSVFVMQLKAWFAFSIPVPLMIIKNDSDVRFFIEDVVKGSRNLLCVVTERAINQDCIIPSLVDQVKNSVNKNVHMPSCESNVPTTQHSQSELVHDEIQENFTNQSNEGVDTSLVLQDLDGEYLDGTQDPMVNDVKEHDGFDGLETSLVVDPFTPNGEHNGASEEGIQKETEMVTAYTDRLTGKIIVTDSSGTTSVSDDAIKVGDLFNSKRELRCKLSLLAMKKNFEYMVKNSSTNMLYVKCVDAKCKWRLRATIDKNSRLFRVTKFNNIHACSLGREQHNHRQASSNVIAQLIKSKCEGVGGKYKPNDIIQDIQRELGVNITYDKAWRAREVANNFIRVSARKCGSCGQIGHNRKKYIYGAPNLAATIRKSTSRLELLQAALKNKLSCFRKRHCWKPHKSSNSFKLADKG